MSHTVENTVSARRGISHAIPESGQRRVGSKVKAFQVARTLIIIISMNHLIALAISTSTRT
jgi:hypothetical protein